jgi:hypothetical protein
VETSFTDKEPSRSVLTDNWAASAHARRLFETNPQPLHALNAQRADTSSVKRGLCEGEVADKRSDRSIGLPGTYIQRPIPADLQPPRLPERLTFRRNGKYRNGFRVK